MLFRSEVLTATDKLRTEFITNVAAELDGPVEAITSLANRMQGLQSQTTVREIMAAANVLKTLIEDVRDLSSMEAGQQTLRLDSFDIRDVVNRVVIMTREATKRAGINIAVECPDGIGWMVGDAVRIKQTLFHVISGALKVLDGDTLALAVQRADGDKVVFSVRHKAKDGAQAPGLGVYLAQRIAELHGGALDIKHDGAESLISCRLPAGSGQRAAARH